MERPPQPAMRPDPRATRAGGGRRGRTPPDETPLAASTSGAGSARPPDVRPDFGPEDLSGARRAFKGAGAFTRWVLLIVVVGVITAAVIAVVIAALFTLAESSV